LGDSWSGFLLWTALGSLKALPGSLETLDGSLETLDGCHPVNRPAANNTNNYSAASCLGHATPLLPFTIGINTRVKDKLPPGEATKTIHRR